MKQGSRKHRYIEPADVFIGEHPIGPGKPVYVIAEAGVNHNGQFDLALKLVEAAKRAGADAVKFQVFTAEGLVVADAPSAAYQSQQGYQNQRQMLRQLELTRQEFVDIHRYCHDVGIDFLATPFSIPDLEFLLDLPVQTIKLASSDLVNLPLLERTIESGAIVIASTGACSLDEIDAAVECFANRGALARLVLMHCISSYPTALADANLGQIEMLHSRYDRPVGFSDHTAEWITAALAVAAGASVLEKHFTLDPSLPGPDQAFSLNEEQLTRYVTAAREARQAMGSGPRKTLPCEEEVRRVARGSVVSAVDLPAGTTVTPAMVTVKRPSGGIEPWRIKELIGLVAVRDISADTILSWDMLQPVGSVALPASDGSYRNR